jgi:exopolysaccharide biosynthesis polyprenyl glycosylphosphotransferase
MLKNQREFTQLLKQTNDLVLCWVAFVAAYQIRPTLGWLPAVGLAPLSEFAWMAVMATLVHFYLYHAFGFYESLRHKTIGQLISNCLKSAMIEFFVLGSMVFFFQQFTTSRALFLIYLFLNYSLLLLSRVVARMIASSARGRAYNYRRVLLVGSPGGIVDLLPSLEREASWGIQIKGWVSVREQDASAALGDLSYLGNVRELERVLTSRTVDEVYFILDSWDGATLQDALAVCEKIGVHARLSLQFLGTSKFKAAISRVGETPVLSFYTHWMTPIEAFAKRALDVVAALIGLSITAVLYPWIYFRIQKQSPGPVIFKQLRVGENGRSFKCYKFRSMHLDAEERKAELWARNEMDGPIFKVKEDPRIFSFGHFLRRSSLDELPQFLNVLRGEMSLVGPRPPTPDEVKRYEARFRRRFSVRPGLTGLWQVSGRSQVARFEEILELDLRYIDQWSLWLDLKIIAMTIWVVFARRGAF